MGAKRLSLKTVPSCLSGLDELSVQVLVLAPFIDDRPLRGAAGCCDWRLNGRLSRLIQSGLFSGKAREILLTNTQGRIGTERVVLFGQGKRKKMDLEVFQQNLRRMLETLRRARLTSFAIELPGVDPGPLEAPEAISRFLGTAVANYPDAEVSLLSPHRQFAELAVEIASGDSRIALMD